MKNITTPFLAAACLLMANAAAGSPFSPRISGDVSALECSDAFLLATSMFNSRSSRLYAPLRIPNGIKSELVLGASVLDISGGASLEAKDDQFEKVPQSNRSFYWEKGAERSTRIAVKEASVGWRGDRYSVYLLNANVGQDDFIRNTAEAHGKSQYTVLIEDTWRPPLVFLSRPTKKKWFIAVGEPYQVLPDWTVYKETAGGFERGCTIRFGPEGRDATALLPKSVRHFAHLLDRTIGPGHHEGTLQSTARLRLEVRHVWANAALRPWALSDSDTYNSTEEVKAGLVEWSHKGSSYRRLHGEILATYSVAERALSTYYARQFRLPQSKARRLAEWVLDIAFRANYTFSNGGDYFRYDKVNTNPWTGNFSR